MKMKDFMFALIVMLVFAGTANARVNDNYEQYANDGSPKFLKIVVADTVEYVNFLKMQGNGKYAVVLDIARGFDFVWDVLDSNEGNIDALVSFILEQHYDRVSTNMLVSMSWYAHVVQRAGSLSKDEANKKLQYMSGDFYTALTAKSKRQVLADAMKMVDLMYASK